ncbi:YEATS protein [Trypanosoma melophagium]|uniref:YEATS protein n=1 Tax=Trypanosoma melophagium TaxID=715481 RepID=UPI003519E595|nr:YEATS protein [Trypanosoma melophagium]
MVREGLTQTSRVFTINFEGEVYQISIDCRDVHTLRELIAVAVPTPSQSSPGPSSTNTTNTTTVSRAKQKALWVNNCICSFGGQRISLSTSTEVAPTILEVTWAAHYLNSGKMNTTTNTTSNTTNTAGRESTSKRRRSRSAVEAEDVNDNGSNMSDGSTEDEKSVLEPQRRPYWRRDTNDDKMSSKKNKNNDSKEEENDNDDDNEGDARSQSNYRRNSINGENGEDDDNDDDDDDDDDGSNSVHTNSNNNTNTPNNYNSNSNEDDNDEDEDEDDRSLEAVIPVIVGGVVRLINTESRDKSHQWTVYIRGLFNETRYLEHCIESVRFILDPSFTPSERLVTSPPFELTEVGWGEFVVNMRVQLRHYPRPIQVMWNSSSSSVSSLTTTSAVKWSSDVKVASALLSTSTAQPLAGFTRGPVLSPVVDVLSRYSYYSNSNDSNNNNTIINNNSNIIKTGNSNNTYNIDNNANSNNNNDRLTVVKTEVKREKEEETTYKHTSNNNHNTMNDKNHTTTGGVGGSSSVNGSNYNNDNSNDGSQSSAMPVVSTLEMCPGVVVISHLLRFSHRPRRAHCIPPLGRPYERDEHIGYTLVQTPVVTEHYDEIVVPDPPIPLQEILVSLPEMLRFRVATVKTARAMTAAQNNSSQQMGPNGTPPIPPLRASDAFNEDGVSCWKYIMQEGPDDAVLAEAYLDSVAGSKLFTYAARYGSSGIGQTIDQQQYMTYGVDPAIVLKPGRGRRKLTGAEIDLAALKSAKKGLIEAIEKMRREIALRQATHIYKQYT